MVAGPAIAAWWWSKSAKIREVAVYMFTRISSMFGCQDRDRSTETSAEFGFQPLLFAHARSIERQLSIDSVEPTPLARILRYNKSR